MTYNEHLIPTSRARRHERVSDRRQAKAKCKRWWDEMDDDVIEDDVDDEALIAAFGGKR